ncbi:hypothetical protein BpHYR1_030511 [Brachionus plicatilis]|uniref:Uncharacterized protein n=1 Tax=Brachionus plicatilis TaxID=10195 RepID=A0A3M7QG99_BRAPC|nr:hypothetical protein BpHYR1_030511 [Brachionus plicatilis]
MNAFRPQNQKNVLLNVKVLKKERKIINNMVLFGIVILLRHFRSPNSVPLSQLRDNQNIMMKEKTIRN